MNSLISFIVGFVGGATVATGLHKTGMDREDVLRLVLGVLILAFVAYSTLLSYQTSERVYEDSVRIARVAECQQRQNEQFAMALTARSDATTRGNAAQRDFLTALSTPNLAPEESAAAFRRYLEALDEIDASRAANPLLIVECR